MEHGVLHTGNHDVDPQDMLNMGGLRKKMPVTFWTFLIGGFALSGFPLVTAGFWSKDEILADAFAHGHWAIFATLATAALFTAFYTMRQITLTFFGEPRTTEAEYAQETPWTMTLPLVILSVFAIGYGWVGIPEALTGGALPNWFHGFVGGTLLEHPETIEFNIIPMAVSIVIALTGLGLGWLVYKDFKVGDTDPVKKALPAFIYDTLKNKYYFDEFYGFFIIKPVIWISEVFTSLWMDKGVIDGILHFFGHATAFIGNGLRNYFDAPVVNGLIGDGSYRITQWVGDKLKFTQGGRVQVYLVIALSVAILLAVAYYFMA
jgi:NADH-quinone oxidoreductase subunit L